MKKDGFNPSFFSFIFIGLIQIFLIAFNKEKLFLCLHLFEILI